MIKTWLKHKIYEQAINAFFDQMYMNFVMPKIRSQVIWGTVTAKTRKLNARFSMELMQDLKTFHGDGIEDMLIEAIMQEMEQEIGQLQNGVKVYRDVHDDDYALVSYKGPKRDSGIIFSPLP